MLLEVRRVSAVPRREDEPTSVRLDKFCSLSWCCLYRSVQFVIIHQAAHLGSFRNPTLNIDLDIKKKCTQMSFG